MSTNQRLTKLEDAAGAAGQCPHLSVWYDEDNPPPAELPMCQTCGVPVGTQLVVKYVDYRAPEGEAMGRTSDAQPAQGH